MKPRSGFCGHFAQCVQEDPDCPATLKWLKLLSQGSTRLTAHPGDAAGATEIVLTRRLSNGSSGRKATFENDSTPRCLKVGGLLL